MTPTRQLLFRALRPSVSGERIWTALLITGEGDLPPRDLGGPPRIIFADPITFSILANGFEFVTIRQHFEGDAPDSCNCRFAALFFDFSARHRCLCLCYVGLYNLRPASKSHASGTGTFSLFSDPIYQYSISGDPYYLLNTTTGLVRLAHRAKLFPSSSSSRIPILSA